MVTCKAALLREQLQSGQSAATCSYTRFPVCKGVNDQVLKQSERLNGIGQTTDAVLRIRDGAHVQRRFNEPGQRNILNDSGLKCSLQGLLLRLRDFSGTGFLGGFCFRLGY
ncbi:hypothetical protein ECP03022933_5050 [Escherichia coli P0302293.3]|nr:hypothetical protein ECP03022932_5155 [Escherichia coli P0302293.2]END89691.1 hypothetical protein ECP03022937_5264 [Escherichia coli P0302293.7]ENE18199.1 hypothetical protein ECP03022933_5050 [Escherichia coli P0302293.3]ENE50026.1 hypothetical protein ECP03022938_5046 [Escherichia coli P0302293.8]